MMRVKHHVELHHPAIDLDGDFDVDVLSASFDDDKIEWYENDGAAYFTAHTIATDADGANSVFAVDIDGDSDMDVLSSSFYDGKIAWYENKTSVEANKDYGKINTNTPGLHNIYPNPGNSSITVAYVLHKPEKVRIAIHNAAGFG